MWLSKTLQFPANTFAGVLVLMAFALSACGFQPLYSRPHEGALSTAEHMATVSIAPLPDRIGQQLHNLLRDRMNPQGQPRNPDYELKIDLIESRQELSIRNVPEGDLFLASRLGCEASDYRIEVKLRPRDQGTLVTVEFLER